MKVQVRRVYEQRSQGDGRRVLVDRIWPRGLTKDDADLDEWCKDVAPSPQLRTWYRHDPARFEEFARRYRSELDEPHRANGMAYLRQLTKTQTLTLLTASKHPEISQAVVLAEVLNR